MSNFIELPLQFIGLQGQVEWVQMVNENEFTCSCPLCGIDQNKHSDENPSNRFVLWIESRTTGKPFGWCRRCGFKWTPEKQDVKWTDEEIQVFKQKRIELIHRENERIEAFAREVVMAQGFYKEYAENMLKSDYAKEYLAKRGFEDIAWIKYFGFGFIPDFLCRSKLYGSYHSPAISIPIRGLSDLTENIKVRLTNEKDKNDRFRNLYKSQAQHIYHPLHKSSETMNKVIVQEGEMKSCQIVQSFKLPKGVDIKASQGTIGERLIYAVKDYDVVYLSIDPDNFIPNDKGITNAMIAAKKIGYDRTRFILSGKAKIDDAILQGFNFINAFNMAVKPQNLGLKII